MIRFVVVLLCFWRSVAAATPHWIAVNTKHVALYTTNNEKDSKRVLQVLEFVRTFFALHDDEEPVKVIAFSSAEEYRDYKVHAGAVAYYLQSRGRDLIVLQDIQPEHLQVAVHEYTHLVVRHAGLKLPTWLNEGLADVYSTLQTGVGAPLPQRIRTLQQQSLLDWKTFFAIDENSSLYDERNTVSMFYAQSWMAVHMLMLSPSYGPHFQEFLTAIAAGSAIDKALSTIYGKTLEQFSSDFNGYRKHALKVDTISHVAATQEASTDLTELTPLQVRLALAEVLGCHKFTQPKARERLLALAGEYINNPEVEESLGYLALQSAQNAEAVAYFRKAISHGSQSGGMMYRCAELEHAAGVSSETVTDLLHQAIRLGPQSTEARISLGEIEAERGHFKAALLAIASIKSVKPELAYRLYSLAAYSQANLHDSAGAKASGRRALTYATTAEERSQVEELLAALGS